jgi:hypothetical protein
MRPSSTRVEFKISLLTHGGSRRSCIDTDNLGFTTMLRNRVALSYCITVGRSSIVEVLSRPIY